MPCAEPVMLPTGDELNEDSGILIKKRSALTSSPTFNEPLVRRSPPKTLICGLFVDPIVPET